MKALPLVLLSTLVEAATYYVSPAGNDSNAGTLTAPWKTPHRPKDTLIAGDTVYFRGGTYPVTEFIRINKNAGTRDKPIVYASYPGETATIVFAGTADPGAQTSRIIYVSRAYHRLERLRLTQSAESRTALARIPRALDPLTAWAPGIEVRDCEIFDVTGQGIFGSSSADNLIVERNHIHHINPLPGLAAPHGIYLNGKNQTVRDNVLHDIFFFCIKMAGDATGKVYRNYCANAGEGITCQNGPSLSLDVDIFNNVITNIKYNAPNAPGSAIDIYNGGRVRVYNNTISNSHFGVFIKNTPNLPVLRNNIFYRNDVHVVTWRELVDMDFNLYEPATGSRFHSHAKGYFGDLAGWKARYGEARSFAGSPRFVGPGPSVSDFRIGAGSAAIDMGTSTGAPASDFWGMERPKGATIDIGAHEFTSVSFRRANIPTGLRVQ